jgi:hypothetical protein
MKFTSGRPSPAIVLAVLALVFAMVGSAVAGTDALSSKITKAKVKKVAKKQANKVLDQRESSLRVAHAETAENAKTADSATTADSASTADTAQTANNSNSLGGRPAADYALKSPYAAIAANGAIVAARSRGVTSVSHTAGSGTYTVVFNQDIASCSTTATASNEADAPETINVAMQGIPTNGGTGIFLQTANNAGTLVDSGFHLLITC